jgi:hypothetical protein
VFFFFFFFFFFFGPLSFSWGWLEWRSHGLRTLVIIVVVQSGAVKIYGAAGEALRKKSQVTMKLSLSPKLMAF